MYLVIFNGVVILETVICQRAMDLFATKCDVTGASVMVNYHESPMVLKETKRCVRCDTVIDSDRFSCQCEYCDEHTTIRFDLLGR